MVKSNEEAEGPALHLAALDDEGILLYLGALAAQVLKSVGSVTFLVDDDDEIRLASPYMVYIDHRASGEDRPFKYTRPIMTDGKPRYVALKNGRPWEIEFLKEEGVGSSPGHEGD